MTKLTFFEKLDKIDALITKPPCKASIKNLLLFIEEEKVCLYTFSKLNDPSWINPLFEHDVFKELPQVNRNEYGRIYGVSYWPQSKFLSRMAKEHNKVHGDILEIILTFNTDHPFIHEDMIRSVLNMDKDLTVRFAEKELEWMTKQTYLGSVYMDIAGQFVKHLSGFDDKRALRFAEALIDVVPAKKEDLDKARYKCDEWKYKEIIKKYVVELVVKNKLDGIRMLANLLSRTLNYSNGSGSDSNIEPYDYSFLWRPAIEDHDQNSGYHVADPIVTLLRDTSEELCSKNHNLIRDILSLFDEYKWAIFLRMKLHLMRLFPDTSRELITYYLTRREYFDDSRIQYEYVALIRQEFSGLTDKQQEKILNWIKVGSKDEKERMESLQEAYKFGRYDHQPTNEDVERYINCWRIRKLSWIGDSLPDQWKKQFYEWKEKYQYEPEHSEFSSYHSSFVGPNSPLEPDKISNMSIHELIEYLQDWEPSDKSPGDPTPEGLSRKLKEAVLLNPEKYITAIERFNESKVLPVYVRGIIDAYSDIAGKKDQVSLNWRSVLKSCEWIVNQPIEFIGRAISTTDPEDCDTDWNYTRKSIAWLVEKLLKNNIDIKYKEQLWKIIEKLTGDKNPDVQEEEDTKSKYSWNPSHQAINTTRGIALHAVIEYALWICRDYEKKHKKLRSFDEIPEVRAVLDKHLDFRFEKTETIRSVYGERLPWLGLMDKEWVSKNLERIFPSESEYEHLRSAAWNTYLSLCAPYTDTFKIIEKVYIEETEKLKNTSLLDDEEETSVYKRHGEHIMLLYARGTIDIDSNDGLIKSFFRNAPSKVKGSALNGIGRDFWRTDKTENKKIISRCMELWNWRLKDISGAKNKDSYLPELSAFGWWFASGKFKTDWAIENLTEALQYGAVMEHTTDYIMEKLPACVDKFPDHTLDAFNLLLDTAPEPYYIHRHIDEIKKMLTTCIESSNKNLKQKAIDTLNKLGEMGWDKEIRPLWKRAKD